MESNYEKPLWHYSMQEFVNILDEREKIRENRVQQMFTVAVNQIKTEQPLSEDTIGLSEVIKITGLKEKTIYSKVSRLQIPSITRGRPLMFSRAELQLWMKIGRPTIAEMEFKRRKGEL